MYAKTISANKFTFVDFSSEIEAVIITNCEMRLKNIWLLSSSLISKLTKKNCITHETAIPISYQFHVTDGLVILQWTSPKIIELFEND